MAVRSPDDTPGLLLWRAGNRWQAAVRAVLREHGLTQAQYVLLAGLVWLTDNGPDSDAVTQNRLAELCGVDVAMASTVLRQLQGAGLIGRRRARDARARNLVVTRDGRALYDAAQPGMTAVDERFYEVLGDNAEMFKAALQVLIGLPPRMGGRRG